MKPRGWLGLVVLGALAGPAESAPECPKPEPDCKFVALQPFDFVVSKANRNVIRVRASTHDCAKKVVDASNVSLADAAGVKASGVASYAIDAATPACASTESVSTCDRLEIALSAVGTLSEGAADFRIASFAGAEFGTVTLRSAAITTKALVVTYSDASIDARQSGTAATSDAGPIAVVRPFTARMSIKNTAELVVPSHIIHPELRDAEGKPILHWTIAESTWGQSVLFYCPGNPAAKLPDGVSPVNADDGAWYHENCGVRVDRIRFKVNRRFKRSLVATLELRGPNEKQSPYISVPVMLAAEARPESLPLPLWMVARVDCDNNRFVLADTTSWVFHGDVMAIDNDAFQHGRCKLRIDYGELRQKAQNVYGNLDAYGLQAIEITVQRGDQTKNWPTLVAPTDTDVKLLPLAPPPGAEKETGPYIVRARLVSGAGDTHYRAGTLRGDGKSNDPDADFEVALRPRGARGLSYPVRVYITFPLTPVTARFPARPAHLDESSASPRYQLESLRAGIMAVVEPWNYRDDRNFFPIPLSLQTGATFARREEKPVELSLLVGVSVDFPIIDKSVAESSIAIGAFYERNVEKNDVKSRDAFVVTLGFDLLRIARSNNASD